MSGQKTDMAINVYTPGCHLLCHDDVIGSRRISYILYLTHPDHPWQKEWGGALRLYPTEELSAEGDAKVLAPRADPSVSIPPAFNQLSFFAVQPGQSFHDVEEVYSSATPDAGNATDEQRVRMAISGWYHIPQEGEEGYEEGEEAELANKSSLAQLQDKGDIHDRPQPNITPYPSVDEKVPDPNLEDDVLSEEDLTFLLKYINPSYLTPDILESVSSKFGDECSIVLDRFLSRTSSESLETLENQKGTLAPAETWDTARPPHKNRYLYERAHDQSERLTAPESSQDIKPMAPLQDLLKNLIPSSAFRKWLQLATGYTVRSHDVVARRFRRGYDYTLAQSYGLNEPRLEVCLCLTPSEIEQRDQNPRLPVGEDPKDTIDEQSQPTIEDSTKPTVKDPSLTTTKDSSKPAVKDTSLLTTEESTKPAVKDPSLTTTKDSSKPAVKDTSLLTTEESTKPAVKDTSLPTNKDLFKSDAQDTSLPTTEDSTKVPVNETSLSTTEDSSKLNVNDPSLPSTEDILKPDANDTSLPATGDSSKHDVKATSVPTTEETPRHAAQILPQPAAEDDVQPAAKDISSPATTESPSQYTQESKPDATSFSTQATTAPDPSSNLDPDPEYGGYLAYMAGDDAPDDASDGVEVPNDLSTGSRAIKAKVDPAVYQTAKDDEDDGVLFSMPSCWNKLAIVLRDRGTMRFIKYLSKSAPSDRWDLFGEFEIEPPEEEDDADEQEEKDVEEATTVHDDDDDDDQRVESEETDSSDY